MSKINIRLLMYLLCYGFYNKFSFHCNGSSTKSIEQLFEEHDDDKNSMIAKQSRDDSDELYEDFYDELDNWMTVTDSMNILFFGPPASFMRLDSETVLHLLVNMKKNLVPISKVLLAWDLVTDGKTAAFLHGRELLAFGSLLNVVPEEDLYHINFGDSSVLNYFSKYEINLSPRKLGILVSSYKRYFGPSWYTNATYINDLGFLLCGLPPADFKMISSEVYKDINVETLNKLKKCSSKQSRVMYELATENSIYGRPYKWSSHEIAKMGMLLTLIPQQEIPSIQLEAITAISPDVMKEMAQSKLDFFTKQQIYRMIPKTRRMFILRMMLQNSQTMNSIHKRNSASNTLR